ncbi:MAG: ADOP family duplicated permease [Gemmatimonadota bacterium]|nr:ADOP family duplicated permease [Gemmatimonadota bacterium]
MGVLRQWWTRLVETFRPSPDQGDLQAEFAAHLEMETAENLRRGMDPAAARQAALRTAGGLTQAAEAVHDQRGIPWLEAVIADLRFALRSLRRAPAFTLTVVLTLGLGIGANTAIFSAVRGALLKPLPHRDGDRLLYLRQSRDGPGGANLSFSVPEVQEIREGAPLLSQIAQHSSWTVTWRDRDVTERVDVALVTSNWFDVMGLGVIAGRTMTTTDDGPGVPVVAVLTHAAWKRRFGADTAIIGKRLQVDGQAATVIGVLEPAPFFPGQADALFNMVASPHHLSASMLNDRAHRMTELVARLADSATVAAARRQVSDVYAQAQRGFPVAYPTESHYRVAVLPFRSVMGERAGLTLGLLMAAAAFVLVIAVANVTNLTLMRGVRREHELAVRASLGAGVARLRRLLIVENLLLVLAGAALGAVVAVGGTRMLAEFVARSSPRAAEIRLDATTFAFALGLALLVALVLSFAARLPREGRVASWILAGGHRASGNRGRSRTQRTLVVVQVAVSVVLLAGAGLLTQTMMRLSAVSSGLRTEEVLSVTVPLLTTPQLLAGPAPDIAAKIRYEEMRRAIAAVPGVGEVGLGSPGPLRSSTLRFDVKAEGIADVPGMSRPKAELRTASPEFFRAAGIPMVAGRPFAATDRRGTAPVVIINAALAQRLFGDSDPVGRSIAWAGDLLRFTPFSGEWRQVVGVVGNTQDGGLDAAQALVVYHPFNQVLAISGTFVVRADSGVAQLAPAVTHVVRRYAPDAPIEAVTTIAQLRDQSVAPRRLNASLIASFGLLAALIAAVGIGGVLAFSVSARTVEIGIRMSLGADAGRVRRMILAEGVRLMGAGVVIGLTATWFAAGLIRELLWGVAPRDPLTLGIVAVAMTGVGLAACWIPAARAARVNPVMTLRNG